MKSHQLTASLRIIGGQWRSRRLHFQPVDQLRPTANRIRETLFNWLRDRIEGEYCLDLFAGSGACGIEALSRGAGRVEFVDNHPQVIKDISANLRMLNATNGSVERADVLAWLAQPPGSHTNRFGIIFIDPPYGDNLEITCCTRLEESRLLKDDALIYLETDKTLVASDFPANWQIVRQKRAGVVNYYLIEREG